MKSWLTGYDQAALKLRAELEAILDGLAVQELTTNARRYLYFIDPAQLSSTVSRLLAEILGPAAETFAEGVTAAYQAGTLEARRALMSLLDDSRDITSALREVPYIRRIAYVQARVFEQMKGFIGETGSRLGGALLESLSEGVSIKEAKLRLVQEFGLSRTRAERIARTEMIGALRRGRIDEAQDTAEQYGVEIGLMWFSALSDTTRASHAALHGKVLTPDEVKEFYAVDGNAINCKCSQVEVILKDGEPIQRKLVERERARRQAFQQKQKGEEE